MKYLTNIKKWIKGEWRYKGVTNSYSIQHTWTNGSEVLDVLYVEGGGGEDGFVVEVNGRVGDTTLLLSNGFTETLQQALVLADLYMREDASSPGALMSDNMTNTSEGSSDVLSQEDWLSEYTPRYELQVVDADEVLGD